MSVLNLEETKMFRVLSLGLALALFATIAVAADQKDQQTKEGTISAVSQTPRSLTVTDLTGKNEQTFKVSSTTTITLDGKRTTFSSLKAGYSVKVTFDSQKRAKTITATAKPEKKE